MVWILLIILLASLASQRWPLCRIVLCTMSIVVFVFGLKSQVVYSIVFGHAGSFWPKISFQSPRISSGKDGRETTFNTSRSLKLTGGRLELADARAPSANTRKVLPAENFIFKKIILLHQEGKGGSGGEEGSDIRSEKPILFTFVPLHDPGRQMEMLKAASVCNQAWLHCVQRYAQ